MEPKEEIIDYEKLAYEMPPGPRRTAKLQAYYDIKKEAGGRLRKEAALLQDGVLHMPGGSDEQMQAIAKARELFHEAESAERKAIAAYEEAQEARDQ